MLRNPSLDKTCPEPTDKSHENHGWSCGLSRRDTSSAAPERTRAMPPLRLQDLVSKGSGFIKRLNDAREQAKNKAKSEANVQAKQSFPSLETALAAVLAYTECLPTNFGSKGCRSCMGEHFEVLRQRGALGE